jgi:hypothetical protein
VGERRVRHLPHPHERVGRAWQHEAASVVSRGTREPKLQVAVAGPILQIVASCTERKRLPIPDELRLGTLRESHRVDLFAHWWRTLKQHTSPTRAARELYGGDHWTVVCDLPRVASARGFDPRLWVASAGYGLVPEEAQLHAYAATFTSGHADSVTELGYEDPAGAAQRWWSRLTREAGPQASAPRSIKALVRSDPAAKVLVVASPRYIGAMEDDLVQAALALKDPEDLLLVSGEPGPSHPSLRRHWIPSVASLQPAVGGARTSLHARLARRIVEESGERRFVASELRKRFIELAQAAPPPQRYDRTPANDDEVRQFVVKELRANPKATHTRLLRQFRSSGRACEQSRFKLLFQQVKEF